MREEIEPIPEDIHLKVFHDTLIASSEVEERVKEKGRITLGELEQIARKYEVPVPGLLDMLERIARLRVDYTKGEVTK